MSGLSRKERKEKEELLSKVKSSISATPESIYLKSVRDDLKKQLDEDK